MPQGRSFATYLPGRWVALASDDLWLLADLDPASQALVACWNAVEQGAGFDAVLGAVLSEGMLSFALVARDEPGFRLAIGGRARVEVSVPIELAAGRPPQVLTGAESPNDVQQRVDGERVVRLVADPSAAAERLVPLPLWHGMVPASSLAIGAIGAPESSAPALEPPAPAPEPPAPAPEPPAPAPEPPAPAPEPAFVLPPADPIPVPPPAEPAFMPSAFAPPTADPAFAPPAPTPEPPADPSSVPGPSWLRGDADEPQVAQPESPLDPWAPPPPEPSAPPEPVADDAPDVAPEPPSAGAAAPAVLVTAVVCPNLHLNPPQAAQCRVCRAPITDHTPISAPRPSFGALSLSTGDVVPLDRDIVLGRSPSRGDADPETGPHLVTLVSPNNDISRSHVRVTLDGWDVRVTDLGSTNGTVAIRPGEEPVQLRAHDPFTVVPGTMIVIADVVNARYDVPL